MQEINTDERRIRRYLLGAELSPEDQRDIEKQLVEDDDYFECVLSIEDEIIDNYLDGELATDEARLFQQHFLKSSRRQEKVRLFESLSRALDSPRSSPPSLSGSPTSVTSWWGSMVAAMSRHRSLAVAGGMAVLVAVFGFLAFRSREQFIAQRQVIEHLGNLREDNRGLRVPSEQKGVDPTSRSISGVASFVLAPPGTRQTGASNPASRIVIPPGVQVLRIELPVTDQAGATYSVVIETVEGREVFREDHLPPQTAASIEVVDVTLSANLLKPDDYIVALRRMEPRGTFEEVGSFTFRLAVDQVSPK